MLSFLRNLNMLNVIERVAIAWDSVSKEIIRKSWKKLVPIPSDDVDTAFDDATVSNDMLLKELDEISANASATNEDIQEWFASDGHGYEYLNDRSIVEFISHGEEDAASDENEPEVLDVQKVCPVSNTEAAEAFDLCLTWLRYQKESDPVNTAMWLQLREIAAEKHSNQIAPKQS